MDKYEALVRESVLDTQTPWDDFMSTIEKEEG